MITHTNNTCTIEKPCDYGNVGVPYDYRVKQVNGVRYYAHRLAWELAHGPIPKGLIIRHLCDNKGCAEITHLAIGTHWDNAQDRKRAKLR